MRAGLATRRKDRFALDAGAGLIRLECEAGKVGPVTMAPDPADVAAEEVSWRPSLYGRMGLT
jgi:hypothetical protein